MNLIYEWQGSLWRQQARRYCSSLDALIDTGVSCAKRGNWATSSRVVRALGSRPAKALGDVSYGVFAYHLIVLGLVESFGAGYIEHLSFGFLNSSYQDIFAFVILGIVLIFRPTGLLGERVADRA